MLKSFGSPSSQTAQESAQSQWQSAGSSAAPHDYHLPPSHSTLSGQEGHVNKRPRIEDLVDAAHLHIKSFDGAGNRSLVNETYVEPSAGASNRHMAYPAYPSHQQLPHFSSQYHPNIRSDMSASLQTMPMRYAPTTGQLQPIGTSASNQPPLMYRQFMHTTVHNNNHINNVNYSVTGNLLQGHLDPAAGTQLRPAPSIPVTITNMQPVPVRKDKNAHKSSPPIAKQQTAQNVTRPVEVDDLSNIPYFNDPAILSNPDLLQCPYSECNCNRRIWFAGFQTQKELDDHLKLHKCQWLLKHEDGTFSSCPYVPADSESAIQHLDQHLEQDMVPQVKSTRDGKTLFFCPYQTCNSISYTERGTMNRSHILLHMRKHLMLSTNNTSHNLQTMK